MKFLRLLPWLFCIAAEDLAGQASIRKTIDFNQHLWASYSGEHAIRGKWSVHFDAQGRRTEFGNRWHQYVLRPGVNYQLVKDVTLTAGYAYARTYPYGDFPAVAPFSERRAYEQVQVTKRGRSLIVQNRSRLEQRYIESPSQKVWNYENRLRHMIRVELPIQAPDSPNRWYMPVYGEIFLTIPPNDGGAIYRQTRLAAGVGKAVHGRWRSEVVYLNQFLGQRNGRIYEFNNTLLFSVSSGAPLSALWSH